ncbi:hypothetical protein [Eubacterium ramulus]
MQNYQEPISPVTFNRRPKENSQTTVMGGGILNTGNVCQPNFSYDQPISQKCYEQMLIDYQRMLTQQENANREVTNKIIIENYKLKNRLDFEEKKAKIAERRDEAIQRRKELKQLARKAAFEDSEGYLCLEVIRPDNSRSKSNRIVNVPYIRMICITDVTNANRKMGFISWSKKENKHFLQENVFSQKGLRNLFDENGVSIEVGRDKKNEMLDMIWSFLVQNAKQLYAFPYYGWCKTSQGWRFADTKKMVINDLKGGHIYA